MNEKLEFCVIYSIGGQKYFEYAATMEEAQARAAELDKDWHPIRKPIGDIKVGRVGYV